MTPFIPERWQRFLFAALVVISLFFIFYPTYLPMVDLPQHAAQVSALDDLLKHRSRWQDFLFIHWDTPYLTMYMAWLGIYQLTDIVTSSKIVVALELLFYVYAIRRVRRAFGADRLLDFVALTCFFGYSFQWGFVGYIMGIPVGFLFLVANKNWIETHKNKYLWQMTLLGIWCYGSHVLPYAFFCFLSYLYFLTTWKRHTWKQRLMFTAPYLLFAVILLHYLMTPDPAPLQGYFPRYEQDSVLMKLEAMLFTPWNMVHHPWYDLACVVMYLAPFVLGYRLRKWRGNVGYYVLLAGTLLIWFVLPRTVFNTFFVYLRFSIFIPIFYCLVWEKKPLNPIWKYNLAQVGVFFVLGSIGALMYKVYDNHINFNSTDTMRDARSMLTYMQPEKRVLGMFQPGGITEQNLTFQYEYMHFVHQWYQAEKHGWADYSFAATHAMPVRLKKSALYRYYGLNRNVNKIVLTKVLDCSRYDYLLMRTVFSNGLLTPALHQNPTCKDMNLEKQIGTWLLFSRTKSTK